MAKTTSKKRAAIKVEQSELDGVRRFLNDNKGIGHRTAAGKLYTFSTAQAYGINSSRSQASIYSLVRRVARTPVAA